MALINMMTNRRSDSGKPAVNLTKTVEGFSIEVMPRTAEKVEDFRAILPQGTRVYIAHIDGTPIDEMVATARRLSNDGFVVMPHFPARIIPDKATLEHWINRYQNEAGVNQALLLGGGVSRPAGEFDSSMQLMETGLFDTYGFSHLHVAGHPEGNKDIDVNGSTKLVDDAILWKQKFSERTDAEMAIATQFVFESRPVIDWANRLQAAGVTLPIHVGIAGPAKLQTLIKFSMACGVGASLRVLTRRAKDVTKLMVPFEPTEILSEFGAHMAENPDSLIQNIHFFPLGGIKTNAQYVMDHSDPKLAALAG